MKSYRKAIRTEGEFISKTVCGTTKMVGLCVLFMLLFGPLFISVKDSVPCMFVVALIAMESAMWIGSSLKKGEK